MGRWGDTRVRGAGGGGASGSVVPGSGFCCPGCRRAQGMGRCPLSCKPWCWTQHGRGGSLVPAIRWPTSGCPFTRSNCKRVETERRRLEQSGSLLQLQKKSLCEGREGRTQLCQVQVSAPLLHPVTCWGLKGFGNLLWLDLQESKVTGVPPCPFKAQPGLRGTSKAGVSPPALRFSECGVWSFPKLPAATTRRTLPHHPNL